MKIEINIIIGDTFSQVTNQTPGLGGVLSVRVPQNATFSPDEFAAINVIAETARCLVSHVKIDRHFNPVQENVGTNPANLIVKCEWLKSGNLKLRQSPANKKFAHTEDFAVACDRTGVFTTTMAIYEQLPKKRVFPCRVSHADQALFANIAAPESSLNQNLDNLLKEEMRDIIHD